MTKEYLQRLSVAALVELAAKEGIKVPEGVERASLVEQILEAVEEDRDEREHSNNSAMRIKEKKYDIIQDEELESQEEADYPLPDRYNETRIVAMLRDPLFAFAYWDLKDADIEPLAGSPEFRDLFLRVHEVAAENGAQGDAYFDIPVKTTDESWYINLPNPGRSYFIELRCRVGDVERVLCRSNSVHSPLGEAALDYVYDLSDGADNDVLMLSGLMDYGASSARERIPQRIISMVDDDYLQIQG